MKNILIIDPESTGKNFVNDVINRGFHPVIIYTRLGNNAEEEIIAARDAMKKRYRKVADVYDECETYEDTLSLAKSCDPVLVMTGSENGVELGIHLTEDLGLPGNPSSAIPYYTQKDYMQEALKAYGIRYIKGTIVDNKEDALAFYKKEGLKGCVVKPLRGAGSVGVHICDNEEDMICALDTELNTPNLYGQELVSLLIQERIVGKEFIVNTVSYEGCHSLASIWHYEKKMFHGRNVYDYAESDTVLKAGYSDIVRYAYDVADAIGYKYGCIHGEYMVDEKGPVLIEVNCRPMGGNMDATFIDQIFGHHETDLILDTYLHPEWLKDRSGKPYRPFAKAAMKFFITPEDMNTAFLPVLSIVRHLKSYYSASIGGAVSGFLPMTKDLETSSGYIYLVNDDEYALKKDLDFLRKIEQEYFHILFGKDSDHIQNTPDDMLSVHELLLKYHAHGSVIVVSNDPTLKVDAETTDMTGIAKNEFFYDFGILDQNFAENEDIESIIDTFYTLAEHIRRGGRILIPERTYWHMPYAKTCFEILCESIGLIIEAPTTEDRDVLIITKE